MTREEEIFQKVKEKSATLRECNELNRLLKGKSQAIPPDFREYRLGLVLERDPENIQKCIALRIALREQGKAIPPELEEKCKEHFTEEEWNEDHQSSASSYEANAEHRDLPEEFRALFEDCRQFSMTSIERFYALFSTVEYLHLNKIEGCFVECGVWRGGSMMLAAKTLKKLGDQSRDLHLFDTFEGLPRPDEKKDVDVFGNRAIDGWLPRSVSDEASHWAEAGLDEVRKNMESTGYDTDRIHYIKGLVENTLPEQTPEKIALLRLDTDFYSSTKAEMEYMYPKLVKGGVLLLDDYGHFQGAREAVDEYFNDRGIAMLLFRTDYAGRIGIKLQ